MNNSFEFQGVTYYSNDAQEHSFYYLPATPSPQRSAEGKPMLTLIAMGTGAFLQLSSTWDAPADVLEALRKEVAAKENLEPNLVRLAFAPVTIREVSLELGDGQGQFEELAKSSSSGTPPYTAIFSVQLSSEQQAKVTAALNGRKDFLVVRYQGSLQGEKFETVSDVATWFSGSEGSRAIIFSAANPIQEAQRQPTSTSPPRASLMVRLGFDAREAPLKEIKVRSSDTEAVLKAPEFKPVSLKVASTIKVETSYSNGANSFQKSLSSETSELVLTPSDLGLVEVTVDARGLEGAKASKARITLRYQDQETTFYFRNDTWQATWFVVAPDVKGLVYEWQVNRSTGELVKYDQREATSAQIVLEEQQT